jgi:hypothetical protein
MGGACNSHVRGEKLVKKNSVGKLEGNRPLGRPKRRCEDNIRMDLR